MHHSVMDFVRRALPEPEVAGRDILEVGSLNVNGSPRDALNQRGFAKYVGSDMRAGRDVDVVCDAMHLVEKFGEQSFDIVISTEMLEHAEDWRRAVSQMKRVVKSGGTLLVTTRGPGFPRHSHPWDYWRFTKQDFRRIFADMTIQQLGDDPTDPGVFIKATRPEAFRELDLGPIQVGAAP